MKKVIGIIILILNLTSYSSVPLKVDLTSEEKNWIKTLKDKKPVIYLDDNLGILNYSIKNESKGIFPQVIDILENSTGLSFKVVKKPTKKFEAEINNKIPEIVMGVEDYKRNRKEYYYLSNPIKINALFLTRSDEAIIDSDFDMNKKNIVYVNEDQVVTEVISKYGPTLNYIPKKNSEEAINSLISGEADIYVEDLDDALNYLIKNNVKGVKINYSSKSIQTKYYIGGLHEFKPLIDIIKRIISTFDLSERVVYNETLDYTKNKLFLSDSIRDYFNKNNLLEVYIPLNTERYPIYYKNSENLITGIISDYFSEVENILGIKIVLKESTSPQRYQINPFIISVNGEEINSSRYLTTDPYLSLKFFIFNRENNKYIPNIKVLRNYKIGVIKGSLEDKYLRYKGLSKNIIYFDSNKEILEALEKNKVEVTIGNLKKIDYLKKKLKIKDIKIAGAIDDKIDLKFGILKDNEILYFVLNSFSRNFSYGIENKIEERLENNIEVIKDYKVSLLILIISIGILYLMYRHFKKITYTYSKLNNLSLGLIETLEDANTYNDEDTGDHVKRIGEYSRLIAINLKMNKKFIEEIKLYAPLHDIGKIGIPDSILKKPGKLTAEEFQEMKTHTEIGFNLIKGLDISKIAVNIVRYHHEKWNGKGYGGLKGEEIPIEARIVALADVYDALRQKRVYKEAFSHKKAYEIILEERGEHFDPRIVEVFIENHKLFDDIFKNSNKK